MHRNEHTAASCVVCPKDLVLKSVWVKELNKSTAVQMNGGRCRAVKTTLSRAYSARLGRVLWVPSNAIKTAGE